MKQVITALALVTLAGCPQDPNDPDLLVGSWTEVTTNPTPDKISFAADHTFFAIEDGKPRQGRYRVDGLSLELDSGATVEEAPYAVAADALLMVALRRDPGAIGHEFFAGSWRAVGLNNGTTQEMVLTLRDDRTLELVLHREGEPTSQHLGGTWTSQTAAVVSNIVVPDGQGGTKVVPITWNALGDAIGFPLFHRDR